MSKNTSIKDLKEYAISRDLKWVEEWEPHWGTEDTENGIHVVEYRALEAEHERYLKERDEWNALTKQLQQSLTKVTRERDEAAEILRSIPNHNPWPDLSLHKYRDSFRILEQTVTAWLEKLK